MNSEKPIKIAELKGKFVVVYFFSYGGINIQSVIDQCRELQEKFPQELVVIGIHTGKALNTDDLNGKVAEALMTYRIHHPVAIDHQLQTLKSFHVDCWPSAVLFAPDGKVLFRKTGEQDLFYMFNKLILKNLPRYEGMMNKTIVQFQPPSQNSLANAVSETAAAASSELPEKVLSPNLMGNTILDQNINQTIDVTVMNETVLPELKPQVDSQEVKFEHEQKQTPLDPDKFTGEKVYINREYSQEIGQIQLNFQITEDAKLLGEQKSYLRVYTEKREILAEGIIKEFNTHIDLNQEVASSKLYVEAMLYYCTKGQKAICRIKSMLFVIPLAIYDKQEDIRIDQSIDGESL